MSGAVSTVRREPWGLVLVIAPSNYPYLLPGVQVLQALVAGNAVLLKPGVGGLPAALALQRLLERAGLFTGTLVVTGEDPEHAQAAIEAGVDKVIFTGSAATGRKVLAQMVPRVTPATMELSGCDAVFVRSDADIDLAVKAVAFGLRLNHGRTCIAPKRAFVARSVATEFEGRLAQALAAMPSQPIMEQTMAYLRPLLSQALSNGAHLLAGRIHLNGGIDGPVVLAGLPSTSRLLRDDFFAPVMSVVTVGDDDEALRLASQSPYALGATIFTRDLDAARRLARLVPAGVVVVNDMIAPTADPRLPFGGRGLSGFGSTRGPEGLLEMTTPKVVCERKGSFRPHFEPAVPEDAAFFAAYLNVVHGGDLTRRWDGIRGLLSGLRNRIKQMKQRKRKV
jgi:acyl-CoA reductase-like NAD-dependent aldehyde dehydrogenase